MIASWANEGSVAIQSTAVRCIQSRQPPFASGILEIYRSYSVQCRDHRCCQSRLRSGRGLVLQIGNPGRKFEARRRLVASKASVLSVQRTPSGTAQAAYSAGASLMTCSVRNSSAPNLWNNCAKFGSHVIAPLFPASTAPFRVVFASRTARYPKCYAMCAGHFCLDDSSRYLSAFLSARLCP